VKTYRRGGEKTEKISRGRQEKLKVKKKGGEKKEILDSRLRTKMVKAEIEGN